MIEQIMFNYENYYKDIQFMASRECYYIDHYQALGQCLEQCPDGSNIRRNVWENEKCLVVRNNLLLPTLLLTGSNNLQCSALICHNL